MMSGPNAPTSPFAVHQLPRPLQQHRVLLRVLLRPLQLRL